MSILNSNLEREVYLIDRKSKKCNFKRKEYVANKLPKIMYLASHKLDAHRFVNYFTSKHLHMS